MLTLCWHSCDLSTRRSTKSQPLLKGAFGKLPAPGVGGLSTLPTRSPHLPYTKSKSPDLRAFRAPWRTSARAKKASREPALSPARLIRLPPMLSLKRAMALGALAVAAVPSAAGAQAPPVTASAPTFGSGAFTTTVTLPNAGSYAQTFVSGRTVLCRVKKQLSAGTSKVKCRLRQVVLQKLTLTLSLRPAHKPLRVAVTSRYIERKGEGAAYEQQLIMALGLSVTVPVNPWSAA